MDDISPELWQLKLCQYYFPPLKAWQSPPSAKLKVSRQHWLIPPAPCSFPTLQLTNLIWEIPFSWICSQCVVNVVFRSVSSISSIPISSNHFHSKQLSTGFLTPVKSLTTLNPLCLMDVWTTTWGSAWTREIPFVIWTSQSWPYIQITSF